MGITSRGPKEWQLSWELGKSSTGKRRQKWETFHGTKKDALAYYVARQAELDGGIGADSEHLTMEKLAEHWMADAKTHTVRASTLHSYAYMLRRFILPMLGPIRVDKLTALQCQHALTEWQTMPRKDGHKKKGPMSARTVRYALTVLSMMLDQAVRWQLVNRNVAELVTPPPAKEAETVWWSAEEAAEFLRTASSHMHGVVYALALLTGLRKGELLALRWQDINWAENQLTVVQTLQWTGRHYVFAPPKTSHGRRTIALDAYAVDLLKAQHAAQKRQRLAAGDAYENSDLVCGTGLGRHLRPRNVSRDFDKLQAAAEVPRIRFHDLRHTHASLLLAEGASLRVIADRLGHSQVSFTAQVYAHAAVAAQEQPASALGAKLRQSPAASR